MLHPPASMTRPTTSVTFPQPASTRERTSPPLPPTEEITAILGLARKRRQHVGLIAGVLIFALCALVTAGILGITVLDPRTQHAVLPWVGFMPLLLCGLVGVAAILVLRGSLTWACVDRGHPAALGKRLAALQRATQRQRVIDDANVRDAELAKQMASAADR